MFSLFTGAKSFRRDRWVGHAGLNRLGLHLARKKLAAGLTTLRRGLLGWGLPRAQRQWFDRQGVLLQEDFLPAHELDAVRREICAAAWPTLEMSQPPARTLRINLEAHSCQAQFPALGRLIGHRGLLRWLRYAAGYPGTPIVGLQIIRSDGVQAGHDPQTDWHRDTFHTAGKAWFFLHAVAPDQGPFAYIAGSHRPTAAHWEWEYQQSLQAHTEPNAMHAHGSFRIDAEGLDGLGYSVPPVQGIAANTLVVADMGGFHRRTPSQQPTVRIEVYFSLRRNPFFAGLFPSVLGWPVVRRRWAGWAYRYFEKMRAQGRPNWIPLGLRPLQDDERNLLADTPKF
ncbi:phytanoyl-CoA dioxygenase family protein [Rhodoferax sp.]|uniref:phytanoyl-CoA dioxygenase family protein n=1 Tax=Rhodoferax sp. TaxID=50421 RepID=UPI0025F9F250|nr:phytanoyl-CoA dioxygenase family protein [Rhodoferax sp.]